MVAFLFMIGFLSGGVSASFAGTFADRFGRKAACLAYCVIYSCSCLTLLTDRIEVLFLGRILGGISGTLLYSVFESWLVAEYNKLMIDDESASLSGIFSMMTTLNSFVAIIAGIVAGWLVDHVGTAKAPFMASMGCMIVAFIVISNTWVSLSTHMINNIFPNPNSRKTMALDGRIPPKPRACLRKRPRRNRRPPNRPCSSFLEVICSAVTSRHN